MSTQQKATASEDRQVRRAVVAHLEAEGHPGRKPLTKLLFYKVRPQLPEALRKLNEKALRWRYRRELAGLPPECNDWVDRLQAWDPNKYGREQARDMVDNLLNVRDADLVRAMFDDRGRAV